MSLEKWTRVTLVWLMAITVTGAAVRLTGSGLGCTDWPTCSVNTELDAPAFHSAVEFGNRVISGLAIIPVIAGWVVARRLGRADLRPWFVAMVAGFVGQIVLGMLVTRTELDPRVVLGHFLLSIVLIFIGVVLDHHARVDGSAAPPRTFDLATTRARLAWVGVGFASAVIVVGTLVTGSGPHTGSDESGEAIPRLGYDISDITRIHSVLAWLLVATIVGMLWFHRNDPPDERRLVGIIGALAVSQGAIGYLQYALGVPVGLVAVHIAGSVLVWTTLVWHAVASSHAVSAPPATVDRSAAVTT